MTVKVTENLEGLLRLKYQGQCLDLEGSEKRRNVTYLGNERILVRLVLLGPGEIVVPRNLMEYVAKRGLDSIYKVSIYVEAEEMEARLTRMSQ